MAELHHLVNTFGQDLQRRYGEKVHKLTLHGGFSCPNRDGTLGRGGCTFCNVASFADEKAKQLSIKDQLKERAKEVGRAKRYLAYFQAYTNTYAEVATLKALYEQAVEGADILGLCVGTRPDCVPDAVLDLLADYQSQGLEVWLELGLQTANNKTLKRINRGHDVACYDKVARRARALGLKVCPHLIIGLPGDSAQDNINTLEHIIDIGCDGIKLHPLHIVQGSTMAKAWSAGRLSEITLEQYLDIASEMIIRTPSNVVYHRVCAYARKPTLLAPDWCTGRWFAITQMATILAQKGAQGSLLGDPFRFSPI